MKRLSWVTLYALTLSSTCRVVSLGAGGSLCWDRGGGDWKGAGNVALITSKLCWLSFPPLFTFASAVVPWLGPALFLD